MHPEPIDFQLSVKKQRRFDKGTAQDYDVEVR
jgi:hypothetical protein